MACHRRAPLTDLRKSAEFCNPHPAQKRIRILHKSGEVPQIERLQRLRNISLKRFLETYNSLFYCWLGQPHFPGNLFLGRASVETTHPRPAQSSCTVGETEFGEKLLGGGLWQVRRQLGKRGRQNWSVRRSVIESRTRRGVAILHMEAIRIIGNGFGIRLFGRGILAYRVAGVFI